MHISPDTAFVSQLDQTINFSGNMNALQVAIESNNVGVSLLEASRYEEALNVFRSAADLMYVVTQVLKTTDPVDGDRHARMSDPSTCKKVQEAQEKMRTVSNKLLKDNPQLAARRLETDCFLHVRAFNLWMPTEGDEVPCALHSATILANMALAYHLAVPQISSSNFSMFHNAMTLYDMAYSVAARVECNEHSSRIIMVTLNNLGMIHHECGKYDEASCILNSLQEYIQHRIKDGDDSFSAEKRAYLLNAMLVVKPRGAAAA